MTNILQQLNDDMAEVVQTVRRSLVQILNGRGGAGAGTIWRSDGLIVTNAHVVQDTDNLTVSMQDGQTYPAQVVASNPELDLAAIKINAHDLPVIATGESETLKAGQWVMSMGHPWGILNAVTGGVIISMGRRLGEMEFRNGQDWIAVNLHLRPGHSGGPLFDAQGRLVGVNTMMNGPEVGVAIPAHVVKRFLQEHVDNAVSTLSVQTI